MEVHTLSHGKFMDHMSGQLWEPVTDVLCGFRSLPTLPHCITPFTFDLKLALNKASVH